MELKPTNPEKIKTFFNVIINDMYLLSEQKLNKETIIAKQKVVENIQKKFDENINIPEYEEKEYFKIGVLDSLFSSLENSDSKLKYSHLFNFIKQFIISATSLNKEEYDEIAFKNYHSLIFYGYCCLECFCFLFGEEKKEDVSRRNFDSQKYTNFHYYLDSNKLSKMMKSVYNSFRDKFYPGKKKKDKENLDNIYSKFLDAINDNNFDKDCEEWKKRQKKLYERIEPKSDEKENKNINPDENKIQEKEIQSNCENKEEEINLNYLDNLRNSILKDQAVPTNLINTFTKIFEKTERLEGNINKLNGQINTLNSKINELNGEIKTLKNKNTDLMNNQKKLWNYLNLLSNGRDMTKSIIFFLYNHFGLEGKKDTFDQIGELLAKLNTNELDDKLNNITKDKLKEFLLFSFFSKNFLNKVLHREFALIDIDKQENGVDNLTLMAGYSFVSFFENLSFFVEKTVYDKDIQKMISQAYKEYIDDNNLSEHLKYEEGKIFQLNDEKIFKPVLCKSDISSTYDFLNQIKIDGEEFGSLCEKKKWKKDDLSKNEILPKPVFYNSHMDEKNDS